MSDETAEGYPYYPPEPSAAAPDATSSVPVQSWDWSREPDAFAGTAASGDGDGDGAMAAIRERLMSLGEHFDELRRRLLLCVLSFFPPFIAGLAFFPWMWELALIPARRAAMLLGEPLEALLVLRPEGPADPLITIARWNALVVTLLLLPLWVYQAWMFLAPGLREEERAAIRRVLGSGSLLFLGGVVVAYWWAVPIGLAFLLPFNASLATVENQWSVNAYLGFLQMACFGFGLAFETPVAMWALARAGLLKFRMLREYWRHTLLAIIVLAAILTPPDPFTQLLLAGVLCVLVGAGAWLVVLGERAAERALED